MKSFIKQIILAIVIVYGIAMIAEVFHLLRVNTPERIDKLEKQISVVENQIIGGEGCFHKISKLEADLNNHRHVGIYGRVKR